MLVPRPQCITKPIRLSFVGFKCVFNDSYVHYDFLILMMVASLIHITCHCFDEDNNPIWWLFKIADVIPSQYDESFLRYLSSVQEPLIRNCSTGLQHLLQLLFLMSYSSGARELELFELLTLILILNHKGDASIHTTCMNSRLKSFEM